MEDEPATVPSGPVITPEAVSNRAFASAFRGYHPGEVKQFLKRVGDELAAGAAREAELRRALQEALNRAAHPNLDETTVTTALGEHAARLLGSARETATSITDDAKKQADAILRGAEARVARMRDESEGLLARRLAEADAATEAIQQAAEADARAVAEQARTEAATLVEAAKHRGKEMVAEARDLRERMLADLTRRRRTAQVQLEQLRAARERLLAAYDVVRRTTEEATSELAAAEPEARMAAEAVARRAVDAGRQVRRPAVGPAADARRSAIAPAAAGQSRSAALLAPSPVAASSRAEPSPAAVVDERPLALVATPVAGAAVDSPVAPPEVVGRRPRREESAMPLPDRPALRPQTVADAVGRNAAPPAVAVPAPATPPALAPPPEAGSGLSTIDTPAPPPDVGAGPPTVQTPTILSEGRPANGNGNGNGHSGGPGRPDAKVDDLFARIRANQVPAAPPAPDPDDAPPPPVLDPVSTEDALARRDELLDNVEAGLIRALKRVLQDEQNELLDRLRRLGSAPGAAATVVPDVVTHRAGYVAAALPWLAQAARAGATFASGISPEPGADNAYPPVDGLAGHLGAALVDPLRDRLARVLDGADDPVAAAESVRAAYRQWKVQQVEEAARHEVLDAFGLGAFAATPDGAAFQWLVEDDGHCPDCDDNALAGPTAKGQPFPTGQLHPPAHRGCRCLLVPAPTPGSPPA